MKAFKWMVAALMLVLVVATASPSNAAGPALKGHWAIGGMGGLSVPSGDLADEDVFNQGAGWNAGASVEYFVLDQVGVGADFSYESMTGKTEASDFDPSIGVTDYEDKAKTLQFGVHGKWVIPAGEKILPYLNLGFGIYNRKYEADLSFVYLGTAYAISFDASDTKPGMNLGVGLDWMANEMVGFGASGAYHFPFGKFEDEVDIDGDGVPDAILTADNWNYIVFNAGVTLHFNPAK